MGGRDDCDREQRILAFMRKITAQEEPALTASAARTSGKDYLETGGSPSGTKPALPENVDH